MSGCYSLDLPSALDVQEESLLMSQPFSEAREQILAHNTRLVMLIARKFSNTGVPLDELFSIGCLALVRAADTFNPKSNIKFSTYAGRCVYNAICMFLRRDRVAQQRELSLETPIGYKKNGQPKRVWETICSEHDPTYASVETNDAVQSLLESLKFLTEIERNVIVLRFGLFSGMRMTQSEVAKLLGTTQANVSRIEKRTLSIIRCYMETGTTKRPKCGRK